MVYASVCYINDAAFTKDLNKLRENIEESLAAPVEAPLNTGLSDGEAKQVFEKELRTRIREMSYKHDAGQSYQAQFESYF